MTLKWNSQPFTPRKFHGLLNRGKRERERERKTVGGGGGVRHTDRRTKWEVGRRGEGKREKKKYSEKEGCRNERERERGGEGRRKRGQKNKERNRIRNGFKESGEGWGEGIYMWGYKQDEGSLGERNSQEKRKEIKYKQILYIYIYILRQFPKGFQKTAFPYS